MTKHLEEAVVQRSRSASDPLERVAAINPLPCSVLPTRAVDEALDQVGLAITRVQHARPETRGRPRPRATRRAILVGVLLVGALGAGVASGAAIFGARTGIFPSNADKAVGGPGEALNPAAHDFRTVALQLASDIPYPPGYAAWRDWVITEQAPTVHSGPGGTEFPAGLVSSGALRGWFASSAFCGWVKTWWQASTVDNLVVASKAAQTIVQAPNWAAVRAEDPHPDPAAPNDLGAVAGTIFGWLLPYRDAVLAGDQAHVEQLLSSGGGGGKCWLSDPAWMAQLRTHRVDWAGLSQSQLAQKYKQFLVGTKP